jgi:hypothetical protein
MSATLYDSFGEIVLHWMTTRSVFVVSINPPLSIEIFDTAS